MKKIFGIGTDIVDISRINKLVNKNKTFIKRIFSPTEIKYCETKKNKISLFEITYVRLPVVNFIVRCSKGTYIRSLVFDFGKALNSGAYLIKLKRTKSGDYKIRDAFSMESVVNKNSIENIRKKG